MAGDFSSEDCHLEATGMSKSQLHARAFNDWRDVQPEASCDKLFYVFSYDEFEFFWPEMRNCSVSTYAAVVSGTAIWDTPCRTRVRKDADFVMIPPYLANDCHWPAAHEGCTGGTNELRHGDDCEVRAMQHALSLSNDTKKPVLLLDKDAVISDEVYEVLGHTSIIFAKVGTKMTHFRAGFDISMPPAAPTTAYQAAHAAFIEPTIQKQYFAVYKGNLSTPAGQLISMALAERTDCMVADESNPYVDAELFSKAKFVLMSDPESYHFAEAVCSGGVPVMVGEDWSPPFDEFSTYSAYGLYLAPDKDAILAGLGSLTWAQMDHMRRNAEDACLRFFHSTELQVQKLIAGILGRAHDSNATAHEVDGRHYNESMNPVLQQ